MITFERICEAVHHAHQKGVIHRDLKPAIILVRTDATGFVSAGSISDFTDGSALRHSPLAGPQPKVLDFGVARFVDAGGEAATVHTHAGQLIGTAAYMNPEQLDGDPLAVDTRSDIYAIGVMLYQALCGEVPFDVAGKPFTEALRILREDEAKPLGTIDTTLRGDLETIVASAVRRDPSRRYASVAAMRDDIRRHRLNEPITARPASVTYQLSRFAARNRGLVAGASLGFGLFIAGVIAMVFGLTSSVRANRELSLTNTTLEERKRPPPILRPGPAAPRRTVP